MDKAPENMSIGAINPYALTESILGRKIDWTDPESAKIISDTLETDYNELFDMKFNSPLYAGLKLRADNTAEPLKATDVKIRTEADRITPDLSTVKKVSDLQTKGIKNIATTEVKNVALSNGKLNVVLNAPELNKTISNTSLSKQIFELVTPYRPLVQIGWTPPNCSWKDMGNFFQDVTEYNDPIQGAVANCYFIAAMAAIAWADPFNIIHRNRAIGVGEADRVSGIQFYSKGGGKDAATAIVEVRDPIIVNSSNNVVYCRSNDGGEIWPSLYEKAFAKWITNAPSDFPDITQTAYGDTVKATAQLNNRTPFYYNTNTRTAEQLYTIVRENSMSFKTINPMTAWTYGSGSYSGSNIVANHAYTVLGWAFQNNKQYIILRNPWGVTEPAGLNTYQGLLSFFDKSFWRPITMIGNDGVFALEASAFKFYFAGLGVAK